MIGIRSYSGIMSQKYLLCRPESGLNDALNQIELAYRYAAATDRLVVVDTNHCSSRHFRDDFDHYFTSRDSRLVLNVRDYQQLFDSLDVYPPFLKGRVSSYQIEVSELQKCWVEVETQVPVMVDYSRRYSQPLLVHQSFGGGLLSVDALKKLQLQPWLVELLLERLQHLGEPYAAVHVRNTDIKSSYKEAVAALAGVDRLFVATDSAEVLEAFRSALGDRVVSFTQPSTNVPLHYQASDPRQQNIDAILDLLTLALAHRLYLVELSNCSWAKYSGFSLLAYSLKGTPSVLSSLISDSRIQLTVGQRP